MMEEPKDLTQCNHIFVPDNSYRIPTQIWGSWEACAQEQTEAYLHQELSHSRQLPKKQFFLPSSLVLLSQCSLSTMDT